jgi:hypothetical protein
MLNQRSESQSDFRMRRITWAVNQMIGAEVPISVNKLRRVAGLSAQTVRNHKKLVVDLVRQLNATLDNRSFFA